MGNQSQKVLAANQRWDKIYRKKTPHRAREKDEPSARVLFSPVVTHYCPTKEYFDEAYKFSRKEIARVNSLIADTFSERTQIAGILNGIPLKLDEIKSEKIDIILKFNNSSRRQKRRTRNAITVKISALNKQAYNLRLTSYVLWDKYDALQASCENYELELNALIKEQRRLLEKKAIIRCQGPADTALPVKPSAAPRMLHLRELLNLSGSFAPSPLDNIQQMPVKRRYTRFS